MMVNPHCGRPSTSVGIGSVVRRSMPTIRPQSASPHCEIATTPWPFAVVQVPTGVVVPVANAGVVISPATNIATRTRNLGLVTYLNIDLLTGYQSASEYRYWVTAR